jgi:hypothetical protein
MKTYIAKLTVLLVTSIAARADAVLDWNIIMQSTVAAQAPFLQARFAAITQLAVFEAVNAITKEYKPYLGTVTAPDGASAGAAAIAAAHTVLKAYFPANAAALDSARATSLAAIPDGPAKTAGIGAGESAAAAVMAARKNDGATPAAFYLPTSSKAGEWQLTAGCSAAGGAFFQWLGVTPFGLRSASQFQLDEPPAMTSVRYARDYNEVKSVGSASSIARPQDRIDVATYFAVISPVGVWNPVARQLSLAAAYSLSQKAQAFALLNMAMNDAAVAVFDSKYKYNSWRPETAIQNGATDGNNATTADPTFKPFVVAPCFPGYPSAHAGLSGAAREVLERIFTPRHRNLVLSNPAVPGIALRYTKLKEITDDIDDARVYGGIHFRFDQDAGADLGKHVGEFLFKNLIAPVSPCTCELR